MKFTITGQGNCWTVEAFDIEVARPVVAVFYGVNAEQRARAYAAWMNEPQEVNDQLRTVRKELGELYGIVSRLRELQATPIAVKA